MDHPSRVAGLVDRPTRVARLVDYPHAALDSGGPPVSPGSVLIERLGTFGSRGNGRPDRGSKSVPAATRRSLLLQS